MALPEVGLKAVIANLPGFDAGAKAIVNAYEAIEKKAQNVEKATNILGKSFSSLTSPVSALGGQFVGLGNSIFKFGAIAGGAALVGVGALTVGIIALGSSALTEVANFERLELSIKNLVARDMVATGASTSMGEAMAQAGIKAQELTKWIQQVAIQSPFTQQGISDAFQTALAYGFTVDQAQRLTNAEVDFAAATGKSVDVTNQIALALGQVQAKGKVSGQELIQLTNAGVGVNKILEDMGFTLDDVSNGLVDSDAFIEAVIADMEIFEGAAKEQSSTFSGLISSLEDLKGVGLREFFTGTFKAIQPYLADFVNFLTTAALETGSIRALGDALGQFVGSALEKISGLVRLISILGMGAGLAIFTQIFGPQGIALWMQVQALITNISTAFTNLGNIITTNLSGPMSDFTVNIIPAITQGLTFINDHFEEFKGALAGIGAVLAVGVFAALVAGILALLTPINLIIAGAVLLGAAWAGNWGGIQEKTFAAWTVIQPVLQQVADWLSINIPIAIQATSDFWTNTLQPAMVQVGDWITGTLIPTLTDLWNWLSVNIPIAVQILADHWNNVLFPALLQTGDFIQNSVVPAFMQLATWLQANIPIAIQTIVTFWTGTLVPAFQAVGNFINTSLIPGFMNIVTWFTNMGVGIQLVAGFWTSIFLTAINAVWGFISVNLIPLFQSLANLQGVILLKAGEALAGLWQNILLPALTSVGNFISTVLTVAFNALVAFIISKFGPTIRVLANIWQTILLPSLASVGNIIQSTVSPGFDSLGKKAEVIGPILQTLADVVLKSIVSGFNDIANAIKAATDLFNSLANAVRNFELPDVLTPGSPPPMAVGLMQIANAAAIATSAINTLTQGVSNTSPAFTRLFYSLSGIHDAMVESGLVGEGRRHDIASITRSILPSLAGQFEAGTFTSASLMQAIQAGLQTPGGRGFTMTQVLDALQRAGISVDQLTQNLIEAFSEANKIVRLANAARAVGMAGQFAQFGQAAADRLAGQIETLQAIVESGEAGAFGGQIIEATQAQELLNEALEDQAGIQQQIVDLQRQQADLQWLQQQISLIQMVRDAGLDVSDILGGITFGLDASIPDIVAAMNNVVQAMINQIDADLAIQSPSHVMADKFRQVMAGATEGIMSGKSMLQAAINNAISGPIVSAPALGGGGSNGRVTNYNFDMNVNTGASPQAVVAQYEVMRAMVG